MTQMDAWIVLAVIAGAFTMLAWIADVVWPWYEKWIDEAIKRDALKAGQSK